MIKRKAMILGFVFVCFALSIADESFDKLIEKKQYKTGSG